MHKTLYNISRGASALKTVNFFEGGACVHWREVPRAYAIAQWPVQIWLKYCNHLQLILGSYGVPIVLLGMYQNTYIIQDMA